MSWTMATINDNDAVRPENVPWNWPRPSIGTTARGKREKKELGGGSVGVGNDDDAPGFAVG